MFGNQRMDHKAGLHRRDAAVAPLAGDSADQFLIVGELAQHLPRGLVETVRQGDIQSFVENRAQYAGGELGKCVPLHAVCHLAQQLYILVDGFLFIGKGIEQGETQPFLAGAQIHDLFAQEEAVVVLVHGGPFQLAVGDVIEQPAAQGVGRAHVADVMDAYVPFVAVASVTVGVAAGRVMLLKHEDFLARLGQAGCGGQAADA